MRVPGKLYSHYDMSAERRRAPLLAVIQRPTAGRGQRSAAEQIDHSTCKSQDASSACSLPLLIFLPVGEFARLTVAGRLPTYVIARVHPAARSYGCQAGRGQCGETDRSSHRDRQLTLLTLDFELQGPGDVDMCAGWMRRKTMTTTRGVVPWPQLVGWLVEGLVLPLDLRVCQTGWIMAADMLATI